MTRMDRAWVGLLVTMAVMIAAVPGASAAPVCFALVSSGLLPLQGVNTGEVACPAGATADGTFPVGAVPFGGFSVTTVNGGASATAGTVSGITLVTTDVVGGPNTPDIGAISGVRSNIGSAATFTYDYILISGPPGPPVETWLYYDLDGGLTAGKTDPTSPLFTSARAAIVGAVGGPLGGARIDGEWVISSDGEIRRTGAMMGNGGATDPFPVRAGDVLSLGFRIETGVTTDSGAGGTQPVHASATAAFAHTFGLPVGRPVFNLPPGWTANSDDGSIRNNRFVGDAPVNTAPIADAGMDQAVDENSLVTLDGSASSDAEGAALTFAWTQVAGPPVTLDLGDPAHPKFTAPAVPTGGATLTFQLVVDDGTLASAADSVDVLVRNVNNPPVADAGADQTVSEGGSVTLTGVASFDPDGDALTLSWQQTSGPVVTLAGADTAKPIFIAPFVGPVGAALVFTLTVSDGMATATDTVTVNVQNVNHPPIADAGADQTVAEGRPVSLDGHSSRDPDGDPLTYRWVQTAGGLVTLSGPSSATPTFTAPQVGPGGDTLRFQLTVSDGLGGSASDEVVVVVQNVNDPPVCAAARAKPDLLWPPDHKLVPVAIVGVTDPNNDALTTAVTGVTQDEPIDGLGEGDTSPDAVIQGRTVLLRAERSVRGNGRVYRIQFHVDDGHGGTCDGSVAVLVPRDSRSAGQVVDDGQRYNSVLSADRHRRGHDDDRDEQGESDRR